MPAKVDKEKCTGCGLCIEVCLVEAISLSPQKIIELETDNCLECGACENECPHDAITVIQRCEVRLFTGDARQTTPSSTKELPSQFTPPQAAPSDESLTRAIIPNTGILLNQTYSETWERELPSLIREKITALWGILGSVIRSMLSSASQGRDAQERIDNPTSRTARRGRRHRYRGER
ncbi:4Fe-4S dicluster domain-containing protein [Candidatus Poribacteria bacterium]|nr:4Fe-4S dicluster domain-containing protein [Candidatus Poribacteria bacterium]